MGRAAVEISMRKLIVLGTIAAVALTTTGQAQSHRDKHTARQVVTTQKANTNNNRTVTTTNTTNHRTVVAPARNRTVVNRYYYGGGGYYGGGYGYPYYGGGPTFSIGIGSGYGYGYGYPGYGYGYGYPGTGYGSYYGSGYPYGYGYNNYSTTRYAGGNVVAAVQARLARLGYYHGVVDGVAGPRTRAAIAAWEARHGMIADGRLRPEVLRSLGVS